MRRAWSLAAVALLVAAFSSTSSEACQTDKARREIRIYRYNGVESDSAPNVKDQFSRFYGVLAEKLNSIKFTLREAGIDTKHLNALVVKPEKAYFQQLYSEAPPQSDTDLRNTWELHQKHLLLLRGDFRTTTPSGSPEITSYIYYGEPVPPGLPIIIRADGPLDLDGAEHARDTHSLVAMFALALDAERVCPREVYLRLYGAAYDTARYLANKGPLSPHLAAIMSYLSTKVLGWR